VFIYKGPCGRVDDRGLQLYPSCFVVRNEYRATELHLVAEALSVVNCICLGVPGGWFVLAGHVQYGLDAVH
jgi:hypothetical protein